MENKDLKQYVRRVQILDEDMDAIKKQKAEVFKEMKNDGYNLKAFRQLLKLVKLKKSELDELDFELKNYREGIDL